MKKTINFIVKVIVAAIVAGGMACVLIAHDASDNAVLGTYFFGAIGVALMLGVFDEPKRKERDASRYDTIRHKTGRNYGQAAVFIGTACLFIGTPQECEEACDDLWHHGQQAHVEMLSGEETSFNVL